MTTAKALGLDVPTSILLSADERNTATQEDWIADGGNGSFTSFPPSPCVRFAPRADIRPGVMRTSLTRAPLVLSLSGSFCLWLWLGCRAARQAHREHRTLAGLARHCHVATHHARELAALLSQGSCFLQLTPKAPIFQQARLR